MKSFLCKGKKPIIKWTYLPHNVFYEGEVPKGYTLGIVPTPGYIIVDVDRHGDKDGFLNIPEHLKIELDSTLNYPSKNNGRHYWFKNTGEWLGNKSSNLGIDLRTDKGYVIWYKDKDIRAYKHLIQETTTDMNEWLNSLFGYKKNYK